MATFQIEVDEKFESARDENICFRVNCPKIGSPSNQLSENEQNLWDQSEVIQESNHEQVEAILSRFDFQENSISISTLQRYGIRIHQDQLIAPLYDINRSLVNVVSLESKLSSVPFGLNILSARNAEIILVDSIWDALCVYDATGKVAIAIPQMKFSIRVN